MELLSAVSDVLLWVRVYKQLSYKR